MVEDVGPTLVLGYEFLVKNDITCHYGQRIMLLGQEKVKLDEERYIHSLLRLTDDVYVPPQLSVIA